MDEVIEGIKKIIGEETWKEVEEIERQEEEFEKKMFKRKNEKK